MIISIRTPLRALRSAPRLIALGLAVTSVLVVPSSAFAASYSASVILEISAPGVLPANTGFASFQGSANDRRFIVQPASATNSASAIAPGLLVVSTVGMAGPPNGFAMSFAEASGLAALQNSNTFTVAFPLSVEHAWNISATAAANEVASALIRYSVLFDRLPLVPPASDLQSVAAGGDAPLGTFTNGNAGTQAYTVNLAPGLHLIDLFARAEGFADVNTPIDAVPEPTPLRLVGSGLLALVTVTWRRHRLR